MADTTDTIDAPGSIPCPRLPRASGGPTCIRRTIGSARTQKAAATATVVRQILDSCPDPLIGLRDRALISLCALEIAGQTRPRRLSMLQVQPTA
jgi:hypothetical protein